jgi:hypothetical protein
MHYRRPRELLEVYKRAATALPSAAPSSPTSQMASTQLSYALTYHLVNCKLFRTVLELVR